VQYKYCYQTAAWTTLLATYEYNSSGQLIKKTTADGIVRTYLAGQKSGENALMGDPDVGERLAVQSSIGIDAYAGSRQLANPPKAQGLLKGL